MVPGEKLTQEEKNELEELADMVSKSDLCSSEFPLFLKFLQAETGDEPTGAARRIASLIEKIDGMALHLSPSVVAKVLRLYAAGQNNNPHRRQRFARLPLDIHRMSERRDKHQEQIRMKQFDFARNWRRRISPLLDNPAVVRSLTSAAARFWTGSAPSATAVRFDISYSWDRR
jgi:hypothetical protein